MTPATALNLNFLPDYHVLVFHVFLIGYFSGEGAVKFKWYSLMDELLGGRPTAAAIAGGIESDAFAATDPTDPAPPTINPSSPDRPPSTDTSDNTTGKFCSTS